MEEARYESISSTLNEHMIIININNIQSIGSITASHLIQLLVSARQNTRIIHMIETNDERRTTNMNWFVIMGYYYVLFAIAGCWVLCAICYNSQFFSISKT